MQINLLEGYEINTTSEEMKQKTNIRYLHFYIYFHCSILTQTVHSRSRIPSPRAQESRNPKFPFSHIQHLHCASFYYKLQITQSTKCNRFNKSTMFS